MQSTLFTCDDPDERPDDAPLPMPTLCRPEDGLTPAPPKGWFKVLSYLKEAQTLDVGCWICALQTVQEEEYQHGTKLHRVARDSEGNRYLVVHPDIAEACCDMIESFNSALMHCTCGGSDCLAGPEQFRAAGVFAKRNWTSLTLSQRIEILGAYEESADDSISIAMQGPAIVSTFEDTMLLMEVAGRI